MFKFGKNKEKETYSWVNKKLSVVTNSIEGEGTFANENIKAGETLIVQGGRVLDLADVDSEKYVKYSYIGFQINYNFYIYPIFDTNKPHLDGIFKVNHSCEPNAGLKDAITLVTMRDIAEGEEITFDYAMCDMQLPDEDDWEDMTCTCGRESCRKTITGHDWKRDDLQTKYHGYFSPYIQLEIEKNKSM